MRPSHESIGENNRRGKRLTPPRSTYAASVPSSSNLKSGAFTLGQNTCQLRQQSVELRRQSKRRIHGDEPGAVEARLVGRTRGSSTRSPSPSASPSAATSRRKAATGAISLMGYQSRNVPVAKRRAASFNPPTRRVELARLLERRIDQHHPAPLGRRQQRLQGRPRIERHHAHLRVVRKKPLQLILVFGMQLVDDQAIVGAHQFAGEQRAARIAQQAHRPRLSRRTMSRYGASTSAAAGDELCRHQPARCPRAIRRSSAPPRKRGRKRRCRRAYR